MHAEINSITVAALSLNFHHVKWRNERANRGRQSKHHNDAPSHIIAIPIANIQRASTYTNTIPYTLSHFIFFSLHFSSVQFDILMLCNTASIMYMGGPKNLCKFLIKKNMAFVVRYHPK